MQTPEEKKVIDLSRDLCNAFCELPKEHRAHEDDKRDVFIHIRAIQNVILSRATLRELNGVYVSDTVNPT